MFGKTSKLILVAAVVLTLSCLPALAAGKPTAKTIKVRAEVAEACYNCSTDVGMAYYGYFPTTGDWAIGGSQYSVRSDGGGPYTHVLDSKGNEVVISEWGTNTAVYSLNTEASLVNGLVNLSAGTRAVKMHFSSPVEYPYYPSFPGNVLPTCWNGHHDQLQAVNWNVFASEFITRLEVGGVDHGSARANFNVRDASCTQQTARFTLTWYDVCITRLADVNGARVWVATSEVCEGAASGVAFDSTEYSGDNGGTAGLEGYGGKKGQTIKYGDWRMPFKLILTEDLSQ